VQGETGMACWRKIYNIVPTAENGTQLGWLDLTVPDHPAMVSLRQRCRLMAKIPEQVAKFLSGKHLAVAGVSRQPGQAANAVFRKLRDSGYEVFRPSVPPIGSMSIRFT